jgi:hypothetical protein
LAAFDRSRERAKRARASVRLPVAACERPTARHLGGVSNFLIDQKTMTLPQCLKVAPLSSKLFHKLGLSGHSRKLFHSINALENGVV